VITVGNKVSMYVLTNRSIPFLLDFIQHVTDIKTWNFYVSEDGSVFVFRQEATTLLDPILSHWILTTTTLTSVYRVSQEEWTKLRESVPYVELYRYEPKHLYPKLNGYGDNGQRSLKL